MGHQVVWSACSVTNPADDQEQILVKGDMLPDWVTEFTKFVLTTSGAVKVVEDPDPALVPEGALPEPVRLAERAPPIPDGGASPPTPRQQTGSNPAPAPRSSKAKADQ